MTISLFLFLSKETFLDLTALGVFNLWVNDFFFGLMGRYELKLDFVGVDLRSVVDEHAVERVLSVDYI